MNGRGADSVRLAGWLRREDVFSCFVCNDHSNQVGLGLRYAPI